MNKAPLKVCIFTSTRADYGILSPLIRLLSSENEFEARLFVTGTHYLQEHGLTVAEIEKDGYKAHYSAPIEMQQSHSQIMGTSLGLFSEILQADLPDLAIVLGDRFEALSFALAANGLGIPLVHLHGGEVTEGALDEAYRHCITKLSYLHFVAAEKYRQRVIQLGENPERVFSVGALGVDNILRTALMDKAQLGKNLGFAFKEKLLAITYHPETMNSQNDQKQVSEMLLALQEQLNTGDTSLVFTRANADGGNQMIHQRIEQFVSSNKENCIYVQSLGMSRYLSLLKASDAVVGNSSSGIIEAPAVGTPTLNIGDRQKGRELAKSVFNVPGDRAAILQALAKAFQFKNENKNQNCSVYGDGQTARRMVKLLQAQKFNPFPKKSFYDLSKGPSDL